jgi:DNA-binding NarL/FixJ family response regulator
MLVEDHPTIRETLADLVAEELPLCRILQVGRVSEAAEILQSDVSVDLVVLDLGLPDSYGLTGLLEVRLLDPSAKILIVSAHDQHRTIELAFMLGATGFLSKTSTCEEIITAIADLVQDNKRPEAGQFLNGKIPNGFGAAGKGSNPADKARVSNPQHALQRPHEQNPGL